MKMEQQHYKHMKHYVACKMMHLVTNLVVPELNLTCLREMKQQLNDKVEHSTIHPTTCWLTYSSSWWLLFLDPVSVLYVLRGHVVINPFLEITSRQFQWW
jgi:hypothetical protein